MEFWSDAAAFLDRMILPMLRDSIANSTNLYFVGFLTSVHPFDFQPLGTPADLTDPQWLLRLHTRNALDHARQLLAFANHYSTPPYSFCRLLNQKPSVVRSELQSLRQFWSLILRLEASQDPPHQQFRRILGLASLTVVREMCGMLELSGFQLTDPIKQYAAALVPPMLHTMQHEVPQHITKASRNERRPRKTMHCMRLIIARGAVCKELGLDFTSVEVQAKLIAHSHTYNH